MNIFLQPWFIMTGPVRVPMLSMRKRVSETVVFCEFTGGIPNAELVKCLNYLFCAWICSSSVKCSKVFNDKALRSTWNNAAFYHPNWKCPEPEAQTSNNGRKNSLSAGRILERDQASMDRPSCQWPFGSIVCCIFTNSFSVTDECMTKNKKINLIYFSIASNLLLQTENGCSFKV